MMLLSNTKTLLSLFFTVNSIFLSVNGAKILPKALDTNVPVPETENVTIATTPSTQTEKPVDEVDSNLPVVSIDEIADTFVIITTSVLPAVDNVTISTIKIEYEIEVDGQWVKGANRPEKVKPEKISSKKVEGRGVVQWKITPLQPSTKYQFIVSAKYGTNTYPENPEALSATTSALAPVTTIEKRLSVLTFEQKDAKSYHVHISKVKKDDQTVDCDFEASFTPCFGQEFIMPTLTSGEKYTIQTWYIDINNIKSEVVSAEYNA